MMNHGFGMGFGGFGLILGLIAFLVVLVCIVVLVVLAIRHFSKKGAHVFAPPVTPTTASTPKEIIQMRYAKGEINREEYQQLMNDLTQ